MLGLAPWDIKRLKVASFREAFHRKAGNIKGPDKHVKDGHGAPRKEHPWRCRIGCALRRAGAVLPREHVGILAALEENIKNPWHGRGTLTTATAHGRERGEQWRLVEHVEEVWLLANLLGKIGRHVVLKQLLAEEQSRVTTARIDPPDGDVAETHHGLDGCLVLVQQLFCLSLLARAGLVCLFQRFRGV